MGTFHSVHFNLTNHSKAGIQKAGKIADSVKGTRCLAEIAYRITALLYILAPYFTSETYIGILYNTLTILSGTDILRLGKNRYKREDLLTEKVEKGILSIKTVVDIFRGLDALRLIDLGVLSLKMGKIAILPLSLMFNPLAIISDGLQLFADLHGVGTLAIKLAHNHKQIKRYKAKGEVDKLKELKKQRAHLAFQLTFKVMRIATAILGFCLIIIAPEVGILTFPFLLLGVITYSIKLLEFATDGKQNFR